MIQVHWTYLNILFLKCTWLLFPANEDVCLLYDNILSCSTTAKCTEVGLINLIYPSSFNTKTKNNFHLLKSSISEDLYVNPQCFSFLHKCPSSILFQANNLLTDHLAISPFSKTLQRFHHSFGLGNNQKIFIAP